jgi:hypothetical protein
MAAWRSCDGPIIPAAFTNAAKTRTSVSARRSGSVREVPDAGAPPVADSSAPGTRAMTPTLSWGQAWTQSRQNVQSRLPTLRGW